MLDKYQLSLLFIDEETSYTQFSSDKPGTEFRSPAQGMATHALLQEAFLHLGYLTLTLGCSSELCRGLLPPPVHLFPEDSSTDISSNFDTQFYLSCEAPSQPFPAGILRPQVLATPL